MNILVTGAAGFIGSHLCEALLNLGYTVWAIDNFDPFYDREIKKQNLQTALTNPAFHFLEGNAGDRTLLEQITMPVHMVVHLAAKAGVLPSLKSPQEYIHNNVVITNVLLEWMKERSIRKLVFASSSSVYGNNKKIPFDERDPADEPISPYALSKRSCELMNYTYHTLFGLDIINLRFFTVYGERQRPDLAIHKFVKRIYNGEPIAIYGDGSSARDYTYYADTIEGVIAAIQYISSHEGVYENINLGNHKPERLIDLVNKIGIITGIEPVLVYEQFKAGDVDITYASIEKGKTLLGYVPKVGLETGLRNFVQWYKKMASAHV